MLNSGDLYYNKYPIYLKISMKVAINWIDTFHCITTYANKINKYQCS